MKNVELVRQRIVRGQLSEVTKLRQFLSMTDNNEALERLQGKEANKLIISLTDTILKHLGVKVEVPKDGRTRTAKAL